MLLTVIDKQSGRAIAQTWAAPIRNIMDAGKKYVKLIQVKVLDENLRGAYNISSFERITLLVLEDCITWDIPK